MKIRDYQFYIYLRGIKEPLLLSRIETERLKLLLKKQDKGFVKVKVRGPLNDEEEYWINPKEIVLIMPEEGWYRSEEFIELNEEEEKIHQFYLGNRGKIKLLK